MVQGYLRCRFDRRLQGSETLIYRDSTFVTDQMQPTMRHMLIDEQSRHGTKGRIAGRGIAMITAVPTDTTCDSCQDLRHIKRYCPKNKYAKQEKNVNRSETKPGAGSETWRSIHRTGTHGNDECFSKGRSDWARLFLRAHSAPTAPPQVAGRTPSPGGMRSASPWTTTTSTEASCPRHEAVCSQC